MELMVIIDNKKICDKPIRLTRRQMSNLSLLLIAGPTFYRGIPIISGVVPQITLTLFSQIYQMTQPVECFESMEFFLDKVPQAIFNGIKYLF